MTLRARRWYYSFAILLFLLTAPLVVATAAGWRWTGWRQGFVQTGTLLVNSSQRAVLSLDGHELGVTPKRLSGLAPGLYHLELTKAGFSTWTHLVRIEARTTTAIGPVRLFPERLIPRTIQTTTFSDFLASDDGQIAGWTTQATGIELQILWPKKFPQLFSLPTAPTWIRLSPHQQRLAVGLPNETRIYPLSNPTTFRQLPAGDPIAWLSSSDMIAYRLENGELVADDSLEETRTVIGQASSMLINDDTLWFTVPTAEQTALYQRSDATAATARYLSTLNGRWQIVTAFGRWVVVQNTDTRDSLFMNISRLTSRIAQLPLGPMSSFPAYQVGSQPLWMNGADLLTLDTDQQPTVVLRAGTSPKAVAWIDAPHLLVSMNETEITIRSVSSRQGRTTLVTEPLLATDQPLIIDPSTSGILINRAGQLVELGWK